MLDLFTPVVDSQNFHHNFKMIMNDKDLKDVINSWLIGFEDRDNKFIKEFQTTFNSSFWELYLFACLRNLGFTVDFSHNTPDFVIQTKEQSLIVEAVTTSNPQNGTPEFDRERAMREFQEKRQTAQGREKLMKEVVSLATERISNSFISKSKKYLDKYSNLDHVKGKPFVLAIGGFEQPLFFMQGVAAIQKVLLGITEAKYVNSRPQIKYDDSIVKQSSGSSIKIGLFNDDEHKHISAVIFSPIATTGKARALSLRRHKNIFFETYRYNDNGQQGIIDMLPQTKYRESLLDGISIYLNPYAENPLDPTLFDNDDIAVHYNKDLSMLKHGFLYRRIVLNGSKEDKNAEL
ncbi:hypothetical protein [Brevibacillus sp. MER 51]|uniref:hypothetical protein n=1 Tax=Brevibacillus sp. MER 51 TaxID=2939560 RepID=UPI00203E95A4|nr:hypothetical protein [Brevibacillus sp. MER 51]MCM3145397.1 hypothetical protein [Brevibacillus sp. MER 51]